MNTNHKFDIEEYLGASTEPQSLEYRLLKRAEIRRQIPTRKSVAEGAPDRIADLLEEAAAAIQQLQREKDLVRKNTALNCAYICSKYILTEYALQELSSIYGENNE